MATEAPATTLGEARWGWLYHESRSWLEGKEKERRIEMTADGGTTSAGTRRTGRRRGRQVALN